MFSGLKEHSAAGMQQENELHDDGYLGPASVRKVAGRLVEIALPHSTIWATLALAYPYEPVAHDIVLAIKQGSMCYVIGVLQGNGKTSFIAPGDLEFRAPRGSIEFLSAKECRLSSREVTIEANKLNVLAEQVFERFASVTRWVKETFHIRAGRMRTRLNSTYDLKAERIVQIADRDVKIDGEKIHLG